MAVKSVKPKTTSKTAVDASATSYGISSAVVKAYPDDIHLQKAWKAFLAEDQTEFEKEVLASQFYQNFNRTARTRRQAKVDQPGVYKSEYESFKLTARKRLTATGIILDDATFEKYATEAYDNGMDDNAFDQLIITNKKTGPIGGSISGNIASLKTFANSFGVGHMQKWDTYSEQLFAGTTTIEDIQNKIKADAASAYPAYADQFSKGISLDSMASAYKSTMASVLEVDPDSISYNNPHLQKALQATDATGKATTMPLWLFERELKKTKEWEYTDNARDSMDSKGLRVLRDMGLA